MAARASHLPESNRRIEAAVRSCVASRRVILAVSGGRDSMALLHAFARAAPDSVAVVATFDHGTGVSATKAAALAASEAARLGFAAVIGRAEGATGRSEAEWRQARHAFLAEVASAIDGIVATAHTRDDQVETVFMRVLRDAGARGLAGLYARAAVVRPLLEFGRTDVAAYADAVGARWVEDPTNDSMRYFRNRVRRDLLPAIERVTPGFDAQLIAVARAARDWRERVDALVAPLTELSPSGAAVSVSVEALRPYSPDELTALWPAIAARVGLAMDWRGTERAAAFTNGSRSGGRIQLSGGWEIVRTRDRFELRRWK